MASYALPRTSLWSRTGPTGRLLFGAFLISTIGLWGLRPYTLFGMVIAWPHAALWGAVGWGRVGLSLRPMALLIVFGLIQDVTFNAPLGCFVVVNLAVYGLSASAANTLGLDRSRAISTIVSGGLFLTGFAVLWLLASSFADHAVRVSPIIASLAVTTLSYFLVQEIFDLGRRPGTLAGDPS